MMALRRVDFAVTNQVKVRAGKDCVQNKGKGKYQKGNGKEEAHLQSGLSASEAPEKEGYSHAWKSDDWSSSQWLMIVGLQLLEGIARNSHCLDGGTLFESCLPSDTRGSGSGLHTIDWIEVSSRKITETFLVLWFYDRIWPLQQILCVRKLRNWNLFGKLHYSLSNTTMFKHGWCAWDRWCTYFIFASSDEKLGYDYWTGSSRIQRLHAQLLACLWTWRVLRISLRLNRVIDLVTQRDMWSLPCQSENQHILLMH